MFPAPLHSLEESIHFQCFVKLSTHFHRHQYWDYNSENGVVLIKWLDEIKLTPFIEEQNWHRNLYGEYYHALSDAVNELYGRYTLGHIGCNRQIVNVIWYYKLLISRVVSLNDLDLVLNITFIFQSLFNQILFELSVEHLDFFVGNIVV